MTRDEAIEIIRKSPFKPFEKDLVPLLKPAIHLSTEASPSGERVGASRIGGWPDLPPGLSWPTWEATQANLGLGCLIPFWPKPKNRVYSTPKTTPLDFIAQINLAELPAMEGEVPLPKSGFLYFFYDTTMMPWGYDPIQKSCARVLYSESSAGALEPQRSGKAYKPCGVKIEQGWTLPDDIEEELAQAFEARVPDVDTIDAYFELNEALRPREGGHQLLGNPQQVQGAMEFECELLSRGFYVGDGTAYQENKHLLPHSADWQVLLQIDSDDNPDWMWGDAGKLYYWIKKDDLKERNFNDVWLIMQCF